MRAISMTAEAISPRLFKAGRAALGNEVKQTEKTAGEGRLASQNQGENGANYETDRSGWAERTEMRL